MFSGGMDATKNSFVTYPSKEDLIIGEFPPSDRDKIEGFT
jgi:hypothetical protein